MERSAEPRHQREPGALGDADAREEGRQLGGDASTAATYDLTARRECKMAILPTIHVLECSDLLSD